MPSVYAVAARNTADVVADTATIVADMAVVVADIPTIGVIFEQNAAASVPFFETVSISGALPWGGLVNIPNERIAVMARKIVTVKQPKNIEDSIILVEKILLRNDGSLPAVPASSIYITLGALVGLSVPTVTAGSSGSGPTPPPGTHKIPEEIAAPLRALFPTLKRTFLDYQAVRSLLATTTNGLQTMLGFADGQTLATAGTARSLINRSMKSLLSLFSGNENELETYGFSVTVETGGGSGGPTPPPAPTPP